MCKKPANLNSISVGEGFPVASHVSLRDTISSSVFEALNLNYDVEGIRVSYLDGRQVSYFEYEADGSRLLQALSDLPFSIHSKRADSNCRRIAPEELDLVKQKISSTESEQGEFFWSADATGFEIYECIKAPVKHTVRVSKDSHRILHRIERLG